MTALNNVLYVEDDTDIQEIAKLALESIGGLQVQICGSCSEAIDALKNYIPQLILLDVMMPGQDGPTTLKTIRSSEHSKSIPVIFMTAKVQKHEIESYMSQGAIGVITKPFDPITLAETVKTLWSQHRNN